MIFNNIMISGDYREQVLSRLRGLLDKSVESELEKAEDELVTPLIPEGYKLEEFLGIGIGDPKSAKNIQLISLYLSWRSVERFSQPHLLLDKKKLESITQNLSTLRKGIIDKLFPELIRFYEDSEPFYIEMGGENKNLVLVYFRDK